MAHPPTVRVAVPGMLRPCVGDAAEVTVAATSVQGALDVLEARHPSLYRSVCDETGKVRRHVNLFVNESNVRDREGVDTPLAPGDVLYILPAVSGG